MPIVFYFVGAAIVTAIVGTASTYLYNQQVSEATANVPTLQPLAGTISPPVGYISAGGQFIGTDTSGQEIAPKQVVQNVITQSQVAAHQQLVGSMGNPSPSGDPTTDYSALWIVGIGVAGIVLLNRK